ncbi:MAG TPA: hypothetical protein VK071_13205 [Tissierellales bacterium]|nr:hypothetical protein [Tissierellales bacterium]
MNEERKVILTMVKERKITSEEAIELLEALEEGYIEDGFSDNKEKKT